MNKRGTGTVLIFISAMLYCTKYIAAALISINEHVFIDQMFLDRLSYVGNSLNLFSFIALVAGMYYIILGDYKPFQEKFKAIMSQILNNLKS